MESSPKILVAVFAAKATSKLQYCQVNALFFSLHSRGMFVWIKENMCHLNPLCWQNLTQQNVTTLKWCVSIFYLLYLISIPSPKCLFSLTSKRKINIYCTFLKATEFSCCFRKRESSQQWTNTPKVVCKEISNKSSTLRRLLGNWIDSNQQCSSCIIRFNAGLRELGES